MDQRIRIAVFIDADNVTQEQALSAMTSLEGFGVTMVRRAYGDWFDPHLRGWENLLRDNSIHAVQQFPYTRGKTATDMALVIDAMSMLHTDRPDSFAIVSSDPDFTPLVIHLRERGIPVHGFGQRDTPEPFVSACTDFTFLQAPPSGRESARATDTAPVDQDLIDRLRRAVAEAGDREGWARIQSVRKRLGPRDAFDPGDYGHTTLTKLLKSTGAFTLRDEGSPAVTVRVTKASRATDGEDQG